MELNTSTSNESMNALKQILVGGSNPRIGMKIKNIWNHHPERSAISPEGTERVWVPKGFKQEDFQSLHGQWIFNPPLKNVARHKIHDG